MKNLSPFHLAIPVENLDKCRVFYRNVLDCSEGRSDEKWIDFNLFGHQLVIHQTSKITIKQISNLVDGHKVPLPHFGVVLEWNDWAHLAEKLKLRGVQFIIDPYIRYIGEVGEQATMFFNDPEGNALEFKAFKNVDHLFSNE